MHTPLIATAVVVTVLVGVAFADAINFDNLKAGAPPPGWTATRTGTGEAKWTVERDDTAPSKPNVLKQSGQATYPVCIKDDTNLQDGFVEVKFKPISGREDQAGGLIWRARDSNNYYVARANALEDNVTIYDTVNGRRTERKRATVKVASNQWHSLRVEFQGRHFTVICDGKKAIEWDDDTFKDAGKVGVWTKADSVTLFDDFNYGGSGANVAAQSQPLVLKNVIPLPKVEGRIDHLAFDGARGRLYVAALENNTVEVTDAVGGTHVTSLQGFHEPQGIVVVPDINAIAVANGSTGTLQLIDAQTHQIRRTVSVGGDADNVRYDPAAKRLFVGYQGGLAIIDPTSGQVVQRVSFSGHAESFQLERGGSRIFINVPDRAQIIVADRKTASVVAQWPETPRGNYPMALDESTHRLFVGNRQPPTVVVYDTATGKAVTTLPIVGDTDDLFYDSARKRLYVIGGEGYVDVLQRDAGDAFKRTARIATASGARTGLFVPEQSRLYVAVPHRGAQRAEIRVYEPLN
jgi:DNA-binding beta-propeller fold protein YncE